MIKSLLTILLIFTWFSGQTQTGNLTVTVTNIASIKGHIHLGLFNNATNFPTPGKELKVIRFKVTAKNMKYTFKGLAPGDYALAIYHDENSDKKCNLNLIGIPTEHYGFSKNFKPFLSAPGFSDAKVNLSESLSILIKLL